MLEKTLWIVKIVTILSCSTCHHHHCYQVVHHFLHCSVLHHHHPHHHSSSQKKSKKTTERTVLLPKKSQKPNLFWITSANVVTERPGPASVAKNALTESQAFFLLITDETITFIVDYTNITIKKNCRKKENWRIVVPL